MRIFLSLILVCSFSWAQDGVQNENKLKAAFIYNFLKYATWPSPAADAAAFTVAVKGDAGLLSELTAMTQGKLVGTKEVKIVDAASVKDYSSVHLLYLGDLPNSAKSQAVQELKANSVLIVSSSDKDVDPGIMINFIQEEQRLRFDVQIAALDPTKIKLSSQLLKLARSAK